MTKTLRVGTRRSPLALQQTRWVIDQLQKACPGLEVRVVPIRTEGDVDRETPLVQMGGRGVFVTEVERALRSGDVDFAVHSLKDLPTAPADGLVVAAVPLREDVRDALVTPGGISLDQLPRGATVGTGSPRRQAQLAQTRPDLRFVGIRGNIDTRRRKALEGEVDATILAMAGLKRSGLIEGAQPIPTDIMLPAAGQGALALQCRSDDIGTQEVLRSIDDPEAYAAAKAERDLLALLRAGCHAPVGAYCRRVGDEWVLEATVAKPDGSDQAKIAVRGSEPGDLSRQAYTALRAFPLVQQMMG